MPDYRVGEAARVRLFGLADPLGQFVKVNGRRSAIDRSRTTRSFRQPGAYDQSWQICSIVNCRLADTARHSGRHNQADP
jgi:hypothetical protein